MIKYTKNDECTEVTAVLTGCKNDVVNKVRKTIGEKAMSEAVIKAATIKDVFKSKVRCHPEDTFDESVGNAIAKRSLLNDYHNCVKKALTRVQGMFEDNGGEIGQKRRKEIYLQRKHS